jgi:hypothetical protein
LKPPDHAALERFTGEIEKGAERGGRLLAVKKPARAVADQARA